MWFSLEVEKHLSFAVADDAVWPVGERVVGPSAPVAIGEFKTMFPSDHFKLVEGFFKRVASASASVVIAEIFAISDQPARLVCAVPNIASDLDFRFFLFHGLFLVSPSL